VKLTTVAVFGVGYVLGTRAGRERYRQILELAHNASGKFAASGARRSLEEYGARLEAYASQSRLGQSGAGQSSAGQSSASQSRASQSRAGRSPRATGTGSGGRTRS
jgi:hypothetical protein